MKITANEKIAEEVIKVIDRSLLKDCIECLKEHPASYWQEGEQTEETTFTLGCRVYDLRIQKFFRHLQQEDFLDSDYAKNIRKLQHTKLSDLTLNDCCTWLTYILQGENICDGHIQFYVQNGFLLNLLQHLEERLV